MRSLNGPVTHCFGMAFMTTRLVALIMESRLSSNSALHPSLFECMLDLRLGSLRGPCGCAGDLPRISSSCCLLYSDQSESEEDLAPPHRSQSSTALSSTSSRPAATTTVWAQASRHHDRPTSSGDTPATCSRRHPRAGQLRPPHCSADVPVAHPGGTRQRLATNTQSSCAHVRCLCAQPLYSTVCCRPTAPSRRVTCVLLHSLGAT
jgi:hypothetical protein